MSATVTYWLAVQSPFVYLGHARVREVCERRGATLDVKPMDIAKVFAASGGLPLAQRPQQRRDYRLVELKRWAAYLNKPMHLQPAFFPVDATLASRAAIAALDEHGTAPALDFIGACTRAVWEDQRNIADIATLVALADACGLPGQALLAAAQGDALGAAYEANTQAAIAAGVFGAPSYMLDGELFWGQDRIDFLDRALAARSR